MSSSLSKRWVVAIGFAAGGMALLGWLVCKTGPMLLCTAFERAPRWIAIPLLIEGARIAVEAWGTRRLYCRPIPFTALLRAGLIGYAVAALAPAGRATAEGVKAALLARHSRVSDTAAAATTVQSSSLAAISLFSCGCAACALVVSPVLAWTFALQAAVTTAGSLFVRGVARTSHLGRLFARFAPRAGAMLDSLRSHAQRHRTAQPLMALSMSRALQLGAYWTILRAVTGHAGFASSLMTFGTALVGGTLGDSVPVQLGVSDLTFATAAHALGIPVEDAVAIALVAHAVQMAWIAIGLVAPLVWRDYRRPLRQSSPRKSRRHPPERGGDCMALCPAIAPSVVLAPGGSPAADPDGRDLDLRIRR
ncbi:MAG TPA: lysylphosphatidylglycerol synthase transmembrane domain-containing protein [Polyangiaceae bacterium]|nr:lysylphosphatidylglycerol synthase transmembrane domain-containing protein [Polyangiaceae bacterium]